MSQRNRISTQVIHEGYKPEPLAGCVAPPLYLSSTYVQEAVGQHRGFEYARTNNPTRQSLEMNLSALENALGSSAFATGMAAISTLIQTLGTGQHVIVSSNVYGGTYRVFMDVFKNFGLDFSFVDTTRLENLSQAFQKNTKLVFIETPTNPLMEISDIKAIAEITHENNAKLCVDNTFLTPYFQKPLELGADYVIHSATKYLGGHSDVLGGILCVKDPQDLEKIRFLQNSVGAVLSPFDSWLILRGIRTLAVRMRAHEENGLQIAAYLQKHPKVRQVFYPGLPEDPGYKTSVKQTTGFGGMLSFELKEPKVESFLESLNFFALAESLGAVESLVCIPALMTHATIPREQRVKLGISDTLIRLSIGIEDCEDLMSDLEAGLSA
jgi:cystathionine beta-lyase/cystathionine gamma-synthase